MLHKAFRGFGGPQAIFVLESAIFKTAQTMHLDAAVIQQNNLLKEGDHFPYGMQTQRCLAETSWQTLQTHFAIQDRQKAIDAYNTKASDFMYLNYFAGRTGVA